MTLVKENITRIKVDGTELIGMFTDENHTTFVGIPKGSIPQLLAADNIDELATLKINQNVGVLEVPLTLSERLELDAAWARFAAVKKMAIPKLENDFFLKG